MQSAVNYDLRAVVDSPLSVLTTHFKKHVASRPIAVKIFCGRRNDFGFSGNGLPLLNRIWYWHRRWIVQIWLLEHLRPVV